MLNVNEVIKVLETKKTELKAKAKIRRQDMGDQDGPMQSIGITATRWAVEQEIEAMDKELVRIELGIKELKKLKDEKARYYDKYFVADEFEYLSLGIISKKSELGQDIIEHNDIRRSTEKNTN